LYIEALGVEVDCIEALYNLGLVSKQMNLHEDALQAFEKLHRINPADPQVIFHIADLHETLEDIPNAKKWFRILHGNQFLVMNAWKQSNLLIMYRVLSSHCSK